MAQESCFPDLERALTRIEPAEDAEYKHAAENWPGGGRRGERRGDDQEEEEEELDLSKVVDRYVEYCPSTARTVKKFLEKFGVVYQFHDDFGIFFFERRIGSQILNNKIIIDRDNVGIAVELSDRSPVKYNIIHAFQIAKLTSLMNRDLRWGAFHCDIFEGVIRFRGFLPPTFKYDDATLRRLVVSGNLTFAHFSDAIGKVLSGVSSAEEALGQSDKKKEDDDEK
ncbi:MAG: hypothetical protein IJG60_04200 [Thermoguttaceae bacterium]|nr:hypothetical protein [Thermoguttaceae bacterium]